MSEVKRYIVPTLPGRLTRDCVEVVAASDFDALAAQLAEAQRLYRLLNSDYDDCLRERHEARAELAKERHVRRVWVGFCDMGKGLLPHSETLVAFQGDEGIRQMAVFPTEREALLRYECVRRAELVWFDSYRETKRKRSAPPAAREGE